jgi:Peptidase family M23
MTRRSRSLALALCALALGCAGTASAYPWPVKPFNRQHPIRGNFGDPRTIFQRSPAEDGLKGPGAFDFHNGVDIVAAPGTPVYPVISGKVIVSGGSNVVVSGRGHPTFQYMHITPAVVDFEHVVAKRTVLGYVQDWAGHVHLTELKGSHVVNPLAPGNLSPYRDALRPWVDEIGVRDEHGNEVSPLGVTGRVQLTAEAYDISSLPVPGPWANLPVAPSLVAWRLERLTPKEPVIPLTVAADFTDGLPPNRNFWRVYARGTYQNVPRFGAQIFSSMPGRYIFNLTPGLLDTRQFANGIYELWVLAVDIRGNWSSADQRIAIVN